MGWLSVIAIVPLYHKTGIIPVSWLLAGGIFYTIGGIIYSLKKPNLISQWLGFHEIFHILTMMGTASHFWMILRYC
jgi:hemolysin III